MGNVRLHNIDTRDTGAFEIEEILNKLEEVGPSFQEINEELINGNSEKLKELCEQYSGTQNKLDDLFRSTLNGDLMHILHIYQEIYGDNEFYTYDWIVNDTPYYKINKQFINIPNNDQLKQKLLNDFQSDLYDPYRVYI